MYCGLEGIREGSRRRQQGNTEHTVVPNVALWNTGFWWMRIVLLNAFTCKELSTHKYCILICGLSCTNPCLSSPTENEVMALHKEQMQTWNSTSAASAPITQLLNRLSFCCVSGELYADWPLTKSIMWLRCHFYWKTQYFKCVWLWLTWWNCRVTATLSPLAIHCPV
jgi:hypothetical protein